MRNPWKEMMSIKVPRNVRKGPHMHKQMQKQPGTLKPTVEVETPLPVTNAEGRVTLHQSVLIPQQYTANPLDPGAMVLVTQK